METRAATTGDVVLADHRRHGELRRRRADRRRRPRQVPAREVHALEPGHADPPEAAGRPGREGEEGPGAGRRLLDRQRRAGARKNCLVAFMSWEGYNFEDAIISERLVKDDELTSIHIEEYEIDARTTARRTRRSPATSRTARRSRSATSTTAASSASAPRSASGDLLVGKVTPKGETELTAEEKLIRAIFKEEGARGPRHLAQGAARRGRRRDRRQDVQPRQRRRPAAGGQRPRARVQLKKLQIAEGDKLAGRHGNKGVISKIVPEADMPHLARPST